MIKSIEMFNFRPHEHSLLEFDKGVNVITGDNRSGKTNVLRALNWAVYNRPSGDQFHSRFVDEDMTKVIIITSEDTIIIQRAGKKTMYVLNGQKFMAVGKSVPEPIKKALNLTEINIQNQLSEAFLVTAPSSQISKAINQVTELDKADSWVAKLTSEINHGNRSVDRLKGELEVNKTKIDKLEGLNKLGKMIDECERVERDVYDKNKVWEEFESWRGEKEALEGVSDIGKLLEELQTTLDQRLRAKDKKTDVAVYLEAKRRMETVEGVVEVGESIDLYDKTRGESKEAFIRWKKVRRVNDKERALYEIEEELKLSRQLYIKELKDSGKCPLCLSDITEETLERLEVDL